MKNANAHPNKHQSQENYRRSHDRQDHGTRGNAGNGSSLGPDYKYVIGHRRAQKVDALDAASVGDLQDYKEEMVLERAATELLKNAGVKDPSLIDESFADDFGYVEANEEAPSEYHSDKPNAELNQLYEEGKYDFDPLDSQRLWRSTNFRPEAEGILDTRQAAMEDVNRAYEGMGDEDVADFQDGFHVTDRP